jgi:hypothetical protein
VIQGSDGSFRPNASITRAEMATIIVKALGLTEQATNTFSDVPNGAWYTSAILRANAAGILQGSNGQARPLANITRQEAMVIFARALNVEDGTASDLSAFSDASSVASWALPQVAGLVRDGIVNGVTATSVAPLGNINRASVVTILNNAIIQYINAPGTYTLRSGSGIILVTSDGVTLSGTTAADILVTRGVNDGSLKFEDTTVTGKITVQADNLTVDANEASSLPDINYIGTKPSSGSDDTGTGTNTGTGTGSTTTNNSSNITNDGSGGSSIDASLNPVITTQEEADALDPATEYQSITIGSGLGDGTIVLNGITMENLDILGGGSNSIHLNESSITGKVTMRKDGGEPPRLLLTSTPVHNVEVQTKAILEANDSTSIIGAVTTQADITVQGDKTSLEKLTVPTDSDVAITVTAGTVSEVEANGATTVTASSTAAVNSITANAPVTVDAAGADVGEITAKASVTVKAGKVDKLTIPEDAAGEISVTLEGSATVAETSVESNAAVKLVNDDVNAFGVLSSTVDTPNVTSVKADASTVAIDHIHKWDEPLSTVPASYIAEGVNYVLCVAAGCPDYAETPYEQPISELGTDAEQTLMAEANSNGFLTNYKAANKIYDITVDVTPLDVAKLIAGYGNVSVETVTARFPDLSADSGTITRAYVGSYINQYVGQNVTTAAAINANNQLNVKANLKETLIWLREAKDKIGEEIKPGSTEVPDDGTETTLATLTATIENGIITLAHTLSDAANALYKFVWNTVSGTTTVNSFMVAQLANLDKMGNHEIYDLGSDTSALTQVVAGVYQNSGDTAYYVNLGSDPYVISTDTASNVTVTVVDSSDTNTALSNELTITLNVTQQLAALNTNVTASYANKKITVANLADGDYMVYVKGSSSTGAALTDYMIGTSSSNTWSDDLPADIDTTKDVSLYIVQITNYSSNGTTVSFTATGLGKWITSISGLPTSGS